MQEPNVVNNHDVNDDSTITATVINGELRPGDWVIAISPDPYNTFVGVVKKITLLDSPEHDTGNAGDDIHVDFTAFDYPSWRHDELADYFNEEFNYERTLSFEELPLDDVIMAPDTLIRITELGIEEVNHLLADYESAYAFCENFNQYQNNSIKFVRLIERLNENLINYHDQLKGFNARELIGMSGKTSSMCDVHSYMTCCHSFTDEELDFYLKFENPLEVVADDWYERIRELDDMSYTLDNILRHKDSILENYPLVDDADPSVDSTLRRYMDIDLELYLGKIAEKVIIHHPNDWNLDIKTLRKAAASDDPEEKRFVWHVCSYGSNIFRERNTFIRDTLAFNAITGYRTNDPDMFGYVVEVTGMDGQVVKGNVFEVGNYAEFVEHIRTTAEPLESLTLIYSNEWGANAGKAVNVSRQEYDDNRHRLMSQSGNVVEQVYHPQDKVRLAGLISKERTRRMMLPIASPNMLLRKMADKLSEVRKPHETEQQVTSPKKPSLADKLEAASEKVKAQDAHNKNNRNVEKGLK